MDVKSYLINFFSEEYLLNFAENKLMLDMIKDIQEQIAEIIIQLGKESKLKPIDIPEGYATVESKSWDIIASNPDLKINLNHPDNITNGLTLLIDGLTGSITYDLSQLIDTFDEKGSIDHVEQEIFINIFKNLHTSNMRCQKSGETISGKLNLFSGEFTLHPFLTDEKLPEFTAEKLCPIKHGMLRINSKKIYVTGQLGFNKNNILMDMLNDGLDIYGKDSLESEAGRTNQMLHYIKNNVLYTPMHNLSPDVYAVKSDLILASINDDEIDTNLKPIASTNLNNQVFLFEEKAILDLFIKGGKTLDEAQVIFNNWLKDSRYFYSIIDVNPGEYHIYYDPRDEDERSLGEIINFIEPGRVHEDFLRDEYSDMVGLYLTQTPLQYNEKTLNNEFAESKVGMESNNGFEMN